MKELHEDPVVRWTNGSLTARASTYTHPDLICLSHLRWDLVFQRPQHLMTRFARDRRVFFVEEPILGQHGPWLQVERDSSGVVVAIPHLPADLETRATARCLQQLLTQLLREVGSVEYVFWYLTPMALTFTRDLAPSGIVFDCMDDLSSFAYAPKELIGLEAELLARADLVFTGGRSLYEAKRGRHPDVYCYPSSVDVGHFAHARTDLTEPSDQASIPRPHLGYAGVIDERMDLALIDAVAARRPDWHVVLVGPIVKIDPSSISQRPNVHLLGAKPYADLPSYLAHWEVALLPFAHNDATRFISPTKTPEYLAAGRPVVSTSVRDVVTPYGDMGLVAIADGPDQYIHAVEAALCNAPGPWLAAVDGFLARESWETTFGSMKDRVDNLVACRRGISAARQLGPSEPFLHSTLSEPMGAQAHRAAQVRTRR
jgi:glycosyltransferase involved in cell wall biosynthesis